MSKPISALTTFQNQTGPIPLSELDTNYSALWNAANDMATYSNYLVDTSGTPNLITVTPAVGLAFAYAAGMWIEVKIANTNTSTTVNINVNALGNVALKNPDGTNPSVGQLVANGIYALQHDGTNFQIIGGPVGGFSGFANPTGTVGLTAVNGTATTAMRSDAAPALSQAISPTWSGNHVFSNPVFVGGTSSSGASPIIAAKAAGASLISSKDTSAVLEVLLGTATTLGFVGTFTNHEFDIRTNNTARVTVASGGNVAVNAPSTTGSSPGSSSFNVTAPNTASNSFSMFVQGGTNSSDFALLINNAANNSNYFKVRGDGLTQAVDQGGTLQEVGWRGTPFNLPGVNYTLQVSDKGKMVRSASAGLTFTVPANVFAANDVVSIMMDSGASLTIAQGAGLTLNWAGNGSTTGSRTLTGAGMATIVFVSATVAMISGAGLT